MSKYTILIDVPEYLDQWLRHDYWNPVTERVEFERGSNCNAILSRFLRPTPPGYVPDTSGKLLPVEVPTFKGMNPDLHNYLIVEGHRALVSAIKRNFKAVLDQELAIFYKQSVVISDIIYAFMAKHGIDNTEKNWETIRQMYARMRKKSLTPTNVKYS